MLLSRSFLFVPAHDAARVARALSSEADAVILDLEDAVASALKREAREVVRRAVAGREEGDRAVLVRINAATTEFFAEDTALVAGVDVDGVVLAKAESRALAALPDDVPPVVALIETAEGLAHVAEIARDERVARLQLGAVDLGLELGLEERADGLELLQPRAALVLASTLAGCAPPIDSVFKRIHDAEGLQRDAELGRSLGMAAKACIHPAHLSTINAVFTPSVIEVERARRVVAAYERSIAAGNGALVVDGMLVDRPLAERARRTLARADDGV